MIGWAKNVVRKKLVSSQLLESAKLDEILWKSKNSNVDVLFIYWTIRNIKNRDMYNLTEKLFAYCFDRLTTHWMIF